MGVINCKKHGVSDVIGSKGTHPDVMTRQIGSREMQWEGFGGYRSGSEPVTFPEVGKIQVRTQWQVFRGDGSG